MSSGEAIDLIENLLQADRLSSNDEFIVAVNDIFVELTGREATDDIIGHLKKD